MRKTFILVAMVVVLVVAVGAAQTAGLAELVEYRVVSEMPVQLDEIMDLFIPSLSGSAKFLAPRVNGLGLIHRWNPHLAGATWKTKLKVGAVIRLPREWVLRGIQGVLESVNVPMVLPSGTTQSEGRWFWMTLMIVGGSVAVIALLKLVFSAYGIVGHRP